MQSSTMLTKLCIQVRTTEEIVLWQDNALSENIRAYIDSVVDFAYNLFYDEADNVQLLQQSWYMSYLGETRNVKLSTDVPVTKIQQRTETDGQYEGCC